MLNHNRIDQVYLALGATDLRKSVDGLALIVQESFKLDPFSRHLFVFCNRKRDKVKILEWDQTGFWLHYKRLEDGKFKWPDGTKGNALAITEREFRWLLDGLAVQQRGAHQAVEQRVPFSSSHGFTLDHDRDKMRILSFLIKITAMVWV